MKNTYVYILIVLSLLASSCQKKSGSQSKPINELHININHEPPTMDPRKGGDVISSTLHFLLFDGLTRLNADSTTSPALAQSIDLSDDRMTYTFHLKDAYWSNNDPITAYDFEQSWKDILNPRFPSLCAHLFYPIKNAELAKKGAVGLDAVGIHALDPKTLVVHLEHPTPYFLQLTAFCVFFPVNKTIDQAHAGWMFEPGKSFVSSGPFMLESWKHNDEIRVVKNPLYWDQNNVLLDAVHMVMISNPTTALEMYEKGLLDMFGSPMCTLPVDALKDLKKRELLHTQPAPGTTMCCFNTAQYPFSNLNIRKGFALCIDRKSVVDNITQLDEPVATNFIAPILKNNIEKSYFKDHDVNTAKILFQQGLKELGIELGNFPEVVYTYSGSEINRSIAQSLQQQWLETLGVQIRLEQVDNKVLLDRLTKKNFDLAQHLWLAQYNDQMNVFERFKYKDNAKNYPSWEDPEYIRLLEQSNYDPTSEERARTLEKAEILFLEQMPLFPICHTNFAYVAQPHLKNLEYTPVGNIYYNKLSIDHNMKRIP